MRGCLRLLLRNVTIDDYIRSVKVGVYEQHGPSVVLQAAKLARDNDTQ